MAIDAFSLALAKEKCYGSGGEEQPPGPAGRHAPVGDEWSFLKRRVEFSGLAGEIVLWDELADASTLKQLKRTPCITGFTAGWKSFAIINVHLNPAAFRAHKLS